MIMNIDVFQFILLRSLMSVAVVITLLKWKLFEPATIWMPAPEVIVAGCQ
jgi:hypothetical protein